MTKREIELATQLALMLGALKALAGAREKDNQPLQNLINSAEDVLHYQEPESAST